MPSTNIEMLEAARRYTAAGLIIHPLRKPKQGEKGTGKAPFEDDWSNREAPRTEEELMRFWGRKTSTPYNIGLQCGKRSGITVLDIDDYNRVIINDLFAGLNTAELTISRRTPTRGHFFFKYSDELRSVKKRFISFEVLNNGSNAVLPPSNHYSGTVYEMNREINSLNDFPELPEKLLSRLKELFKTSDKLEAAHNKCRKCLKTVFKEQAQELKNKDFWHSSTGRDITLALMIELYANGVGKEELTLACKMMFREDYSQEQTEKELSYVLDYADNQGGKPWTCETLRSKCNIITIGNEGKSLCDGCRPAGATKRRRQKREGEKTGSKSAILCDDLSEAFIETYAVKTLEDGDLRIYGNGIYQTCKNKYTANNMMVVLAGEMGLILTPAQIKDALEMVKSKTPSGEIETPLSLIPVNNGVLNLDTMELEEYTPENVFLSKYPINYNPGAKEPVKFKEMIKTTFAGVEEQIPLVQEIFGYCFLRSYFIESVFFLIGDGGNGKTLLLNILSALLGGSEHCSYLSFKELAEPKNENMLCNLFGKSANICGDTGKQKLKETDTLKKASGNDYIRARKLYKESFNFKNYAKIILSFNRLPEVEDFSNGFKRRLRIIEFPNQFIEGAEGTNKNLDKEIIEGGELEGVFLWALEGLKRLMAACTLSNTKSTALRGLEYAKKSIPIYFFVRECIEGEQGGFVRKGELLEAYTKYATYNRLPQLTAQEFKKELIKECKEIGIETGEKRNQKSSDRPYGFNNIKIDKQALAEKTGEKFIPSPTDGAKGEQARFKPVYIGFEKTREVLAYIHENPKNTQIT